MITEPAPAKINLALHIRARRDDGYHEIETLFAFCRDGDVLTLVEGPLALGIAGPFGERLKSEGDNLILRAARAYAVAFETPETGAFTLDKRLPIASGIGGGSADAAAALRALARRDGVSPDDPRLVACAERLGSDVPACLLGRTALGTGRGDALRPLPPLVDLPVLLVNPLVGVSTAAVFAAWDGVDRGAVDAGDTLTAARAGRNDLEAPARRLAPVIDIVLADLADTGATLVRMSGSGATCFALYETAAQRAHAAATVRAERPAWWCLETALA